MFLRLIRELLENLIDVLFRSILLLSGNSVFPQFFLNITNLFNIQKQLQMCEDQNGGHFQHLMLMNELSMYQIYNFLILLTIY